MSAVGPRVWPWVPAGLLACMLAGLGSMAVIATRDPGFALERDYYAKAVTYDRVIAQRAENARLGWSAQADVGRASSRDGTELVVRLKDAAGPATGARVRIEALRNASAGRVLEAELTERSAGEYEGRLPMHYGGLWEIRVTAERGNDRFTAVERKVVSEATP
jgi:nitrogen fixation protein FixH